MPDSMDGGRRVASQLDAQHKQADPPGLQPLLLGRGDRDLPEELQRSDVRDGERSGQRGRLLEWHDNADADAGRDQPADDLGAVNDETARRRSAGPSASAACQGRFSALGHARNDDAATSGGKGAMTPRTAVAALAAIAG